MKIVPVVCGVGESVMEKIKVGLGEVENPKVMVESGRVRVVGLVYLPTHPALDREE